MKKILYILFIITFVSCTNTEDANRQAFIKQLTQGTWFLPDLTTPNIASTTPIVFNTDGSFTYDFVDLNDITIPTLFSLDIIGHDTFAFYRFTYAFEGEDLQLFIGVGIGLNTESQKTVVYQSTFEETPPRPGTGTSSEDIQNWYKTLYQESNIITHRGTIILAIQ